MEKETKDKTKVALAAGAGAGLIGWIQGTALDHVIAEKIGAAISTGDLKSLVAYIGIFLLIWIQVKGLRREVRGLNLTLSDPDGTIVKNFAKGELRMNAIEELHAKDQRATENYFLDHEHRITILEQITNPMGGNTHERTSLI